MVKIFFFIFVFSFNFLLIAKDEIKQTTPLSGYFFSEPSTQAMQDEDFINPGFLWVERGKKLWFRKDSNKEGAESCNSCHGDFKKMKSVSLNYPRKLNNSKKLINLEQRINLCRKDNMNLDAYEPESQNLLSLSALISLQSRGLEQNIKINETNKEWFELGKKLYYKKIGQMGLSCNQCHDDRVGLNLRAEKVSQGQINGFPSYLLRWSKLVSVHKRIEFCNEQARAIPFKIFSNEYNALQLYLLWRGNGLKVEAPSVRK